MDKDALEKALKAWGEHPGPLPAIEAAITAYLEAVGGLIVPRNPTDAMCLAGYEAERSYGMCDNKRELARQECEHVYRAMITASQEGQDQ